MDPEIRDNVEARHYELPIGHEVAVVTYNLSGHNLMITATLVPEALEGQGIASRMAKHVVADAGARVLLILPVYPFFSAWLQKHPEHAHVVHPTHRTASGL